MKPWTARKPLKNQLLPKDYKLLAILSIFFILFQELAKLLEDQHGYIDLQNIPENKYYSMTQNSNEEEKL